MAAVITSSLNGGGVAQHPALRHIRSCVKGAFFAALATIAIAALVIGVTMLFSRDDERSYLNDEELAWIARYDRWVEDAPNQACGHELTPVVSGRLPTAPTGRLQGAERAARAACRGTAPWGRANRLVHAELASARMLPRHAGVDDESHIDPVLGRVASELAERKVTARCYSTADWYHVNIERQALTGERDVWAVGLAEPGLVHLDGDEVCEPLERFYEEDYVPDQNNERSILATALVVLAHEAEHNYSFDNSEAVVECYAVQEVREMVTDIGLRDDLAADIAAYAWDVSYIRGDPVYSTGRCRNKARSTSTPKATSGPSRRSAT
jgi:hypothetical protein